MAVTQLNSTTLTSLVGPNDTRNIAVGSTANISVGNLLYVASRGAQEVWKVQEIPVSGQVNVIRGYNGTRARTIQAAAVLYIGSPEVFKQVRDNAGALVGDSSFLPDYCVPGTRARDFAGNEYVMVDLQATVYTGVTVLIDGANDGTFFGVVLVAGRQGAVGVMAEEGTSNQWAWAQIYGRCKAQDAGGTSAGDSTYIATAATSVSSPAAGMAISANTSGIADAYVIQGMFVDGVATTATTSATSHTGVEVPVFLSYPFVNSTRTLITS